MSDPRYAIIPRHDTSTNWAINNPVLAFGEYGIEDDTHRIKRGNGLSHWIELSYDTFGIQTSNAEAIEYDNDNSSLEAENVQQAIDELDNKIINKQSLPSGGLRGQILKKRSNQDYDVIWEVGAGSDVYNELSSLQNQIDNIEAQVQIMPVASSNYLNKIVQYIGITNNTYTNGFYYKCIEDIGNYKWINVMVQGNTIIKEYYDSEETLLEDNPEEGNYIVNSSIEKDWTPIWIERGEIAVQKPEIYLDRYSILDNKSKEECTITSGVAYLVLDNTYTDRIASLNSALLSSCEGVTISSIGSTTRVGYRIYNKNDYTYYYVDATASGVADPSIIIDLQDLATRLPEGVVISDCAISFIAISTETAGGITDLSDRITITGNIKYEERGNFLCYYNGTSINLLNEINNVVTYQLDSKSIIYNSYGKQPGKNVHIYRFGGNSNDWCFVRTPPSYNPNRKKPHPFVICCHGNGWVMNGTLEKANWTKRTMYVPLDDPDYLANPTQYNGTADSSLWYSNPTIEYLLANDYIVCGCENYGDTLYGNDNCRQACADFYEHMISNFNVEKRCFMIGASNGAMTCLNAVYELGDKIKAMILQYPLTCLWNHYTNYEPHQASIRLAYGITNANITEQEFKSVTRTHDPLTVNTVNNIKVGYFPPTKFYYSSTDTVTVASYNSRALIAVLNNSYIINEGVQIDAGSQEQMNHGDYRHFNPEQYYSWFEKYR